MKYGAPGTIRTCDPLIRSQVLYPAELRARRALSYSRASLFQVRVDGTASVGDAKKSLRANHAPWEGKGSRWNRLSKVD